jgi:hypothetical protein
MPHPHAAIERPGKRGAFLHRQMGLVGAVEGGKDTLMHGALRVVGMLSL